MPEKQSKCVKLNYETWLKMKREKFEASAISIETKNLLSLDHPQSAGDTPKNSSVFETIADAVSWLSDGRDEKLHQCSRLLSSKQVFDVASLNSDMHLQVLVTGSVHLVGGFLSILDPPSDET